MLAFEGLLCVLALIRGFQTYRTKGSLFHSSRQLLGILIRDSVLYFLVCALHFFIEKAVTDFYAPDCNFTPTVSALPI